MGTLVNREDFLRQLQSVGYGLSAKEIQEQSTCLIFRDGEMVSFNDEICCRAPSPLGEFTGAVKAAKLIEILEKRTEDELVVEAKGTRLFINYNKPGKNGKKERTIASSWVYTEAEIWLPVEQVEVCGEWHPLHDDFAEAVRLVAACSGKDASMPDTMHVHVHPKFLEAFDNFQFARYKIPTGVQTPFQVKASSLKCIVQLGMDEFGETENWLHFRNTHTKLVFSCRRWLDEYRDLSPVFKLNEGEIISLPKTLGEAVARAEVFSSEEQDNEVKVEMRPGALRVKGLGASGGHWESKKLSYQGRPCSFVISPKLLGELPAKGNEVHLTEDRLWINGGRYRYVTILGPVEENGNGGGE